MSHFLPAASHKQRIKMMRIGVKQKDENSAKKSHGKECMKKDTEDYSESKLSVNLPFPSLRASAQIQKALLLA